MKKIKYMDRTTCTVVLDNRTGKTKYKVIVRYRDDSNNLVQKTKVLGILCDGSKSQLRAAEKQAEIFRQEIELALDREEDDALNNDIDFAEFCKNVWLEDKIRQYKCGELRRGTISLYQRILTQKRKKCGIVDYFEKHRISLQNLKKSHILAFQSWQLDKGLTQKSAKLHVDFIKQILEFAVQNDYLLYNQGNRIKNIKIKTKIERPWYTYEDLQTMFKAAENDKNVKNKPLGTVIFLCSYLGLRREEAMGLRWGDIDFETNMITIRHTATDYDGEVTYEDLTKSANGYRSLPISDSVRSFLLNLKERQKKDKATHKTYFESEYVVRFEDGTLPRPKYASAGFLRFIKKNNLKYITLHGLRHSFQANMENDGVPDVIRARAMGDDLMTLKEYSHNNLLEMIKAIKEYQKKLDSAEKNGDNIEEHVGAHLEG